MRDAFPYESPIGFRRIIGNLNFESTLGSRGRDTLPTQVELRISLLATLMRVFGESTDRLWTSAPVDASCLLTVPNLPHPKLESGALSELDDAVAVLPWAVTNEVEQLRRHTKLTRAQPPADEISIAARLWSCPSTDAAIASTVNDREFCHELATAEDLTLSGALILSSVSELERHLAAGGARMSPQERWVLKARFSAAGRERVLGQGRLTEELRRRVASLFRRHDRLLFEPWLSRELDVGTAAIHDGETCHVVGAHLQHMDGYGRIQSIEVGRAATESLTPAENEEIQRVTKVVGERLAACGYRGAFGIDAWRYRDANDEFHFHPLGEINARLTFGFVAHALVERLHESLGVNSDTTLVLHLTERDISPTAHEIPLVLSTSEGRSVASLEIRR